ncbi:CheR family methyltransferase [Shewanella zhangzhouensis]|uniref:CheR family methyltransferase n=1 Tax=Shewanella zhangzhouensis TaxID=2864213 RepID=UPI001C65E30F|nr:protein-glutamate O-methyltransferase CheR [Shewanella zhangzhouensis]QYK03555.1 protein-glutamate O-methyltransferase CheR [Shewanella zhangzhouensis]
MNDRYEVYNTGIVLTDKEFILFSSWMYNIAGIRLASNKRALVASRLSSRLRELKLISFGQYFDIISSTNTPAAVDERQRAIDLLTTNETFFFREPAHFEFIKDFVLPRKRGQTLRCWSAASSTGEEAYTLAMILARFHNGDWKITGTDICSRVISHAQQGVYSLMRSEHIPIEYLHDYCLRGIGSKSNSLKIKSELRKKVTFHKENLLNVQSRLGMFDVILLRNVLIYFDLKSKQQVIRNIIRQMKSDSLLIVGHAESLNGVTNNLQLVRPSIYSLKVS